MTNDDRDTSHHSSPAEDPDGASRSSASPEGSAAPAGSARTGRRGRGRGRKQLPLWQETGLLLVIAMVLAVVIKSFFLQAFYIPSGSMEPGLQINDRILVQKVSYWGGGTPQRGDVVVFKDPGGWLSQAEDAGPTNAVAQLMARIGLYPTGGHLVKRVIGVAGDTITCCDDQGRILVNGTPLDEDSYIAPQTECNGPMVGEPHFCDWSAGPVPEGDIFVMGDHRDESDDSSAKLCLDPETECVPGREFVPADLVVGKVFAVVWPRDHWRWLTRPDDFPEIPDR